MTTGLDALVTPKTLSLTTVAPVSVPTITATQHRLEVHK